MTDSNTDPRTGHSPSWRNVWAVSGTSFLTDVSSEMVHTLIPLLLANVLGIRTATIGLIEGMAESTASLLKLFSGTISDRLRHRKWLAVGGYLLSALAKPGFYFAATWNAVAGVRWIERAGKGVRTAPRDALLADSVTRSRRGLAFGFHRAADSAGAVLGYGDSARTDNPALIISYREIVEGSLMLARHICLVASLVNSDNRLVVEVNPPLIR